MLPSGGSREKIKAPGRGIHRLTSRIEKRHTPWQGPKKLKNKKLPYIASERTILYTFNGNI